LRALRGVAGATLLQDGRVALLLHLPDLLDPAAAPAASRPAVQRERDAGSGGGTVAVATALDVLVVDDSPTIRRLLARMLKDIGWQPREAKDGAEALESIRARRPDVVLADIEMPRLDGYGLLAALRAQPDTASLPVVMLTSRTAQRHRDRAMELGANGYLTKPYRPAEVTAAVRDVVAQSSALALA
jgi:chemosensory pili system protein ChpA (sensor histidine kinase/response regulator)